MIHYMFTENVKLSDVLYMHYCVHFCIELIVRSSELEVVKYLIEAQGCSTDCTDEDGRTPLHHACW